MADGGFSVKRRKIAPERNEYREALEQIANFVDNELGNGRTLPSRPDDTEWKLQRVITIRKLNEFREKLDTVCASPNSSRLVGNESSGNSFVGTLKSMIGQTCTPWLTNIGNGLTSNPLVANIGKIVNYTGTCIGGVPIKTDSHISEKYLREIEAVLEEDMTLTRPLAEWLNVSNQLDANVQASFGVSLTSGAFNTVNKVLLDIFKHSNSFKSFDDIISHLEQGKYSVYIGNDVKVEKLEKLYQCLSSSPQFADRIRRVLSTLSAKPEVVRVFVDGVRAYHSILGISGSSVAPTLQDGRNPEVSNTGEVSVFSVFKTIKLAISVISLINAASIIRHGTSQYSDALKQLTHSLAWELERMENL